MEHLHFPSVFHEDGSVICACGRTFANQSKFSQHQQGIAVPIAGTRES